MAQTPLLAVLAIVVVTGGGAALLFAQEPAPEAAAQASGPDPGFDPLDLDAGDCAGPLNRTLEAACHVAGLLP